VRQAWASIIPPRRKEPRSLSRPSSWPSASVSTFAVSDQHSMSPPAANAVRGLYEPSRSATADIQRCSGGQLFFDPHLLTQIGTVFDPGGRQTPHASVDARHCFSRVREPPFFLSRIPIHAPRATTARCEDNKETDHEDDRFCSSRPDGSDGLCCFRERLGRAEVLGEPSERGRRRLEQLHTANAPGPTRRGGFALFGDAPILRQGLFPARQASIAGCR
jgi:hypothetical protein